MHVCQNSLLQELLSHNVDEDAARGKRMVLSVAREREFSR
jgi:hypothetical protein